MLKRFEVVGFKNFGQRISIDFSDVRDYQFNQNCIRNGLLNKLIVYGKNAVGKSNLGLAIFDIVTHLTDKNVTPGLYDFYLNADSAPANAEFLYVFQFGDVEITYRYRKTDVSILSYEEVFIDGQLIFTYDYETRNGNFDGLRRYTASLNLDFRDAKLSVLRYVVNNSQAEDIAPLNLLISFVSKMLWFRSLDEHRYIGNRSDSSDYYKFIFDNDRDYLEEFEDLLEQAGINETLEASLTPSGEKMLYFAKKKPLPFFKAASNGTKALYALFYWIKTGDALSFLFIDEFDAYYHVELAETIVKMLEEQDKFQTILTSHNTNLLTNRIMRPDCYFILTSDRMVSFANATKRELREGHNLEKLYISGEFDE